MPPLFQPRSIIITSAKSDVVLPSSTDGRLADAAVAAKAVRTRNVDQYLYGSPRGESVYATMPRCDPQSTCLDISTCRGRCRHRDCGDDGALKRQQTCELTSGDWPSIAPSRSLALGTTPPNFEPHSFDRGISDSPRRLKNLSQSRLPTQPTPHRPGSPATHFSFSDRLNTNSAAGALQDWIDGHRRPDLRIRG